MFTLSHTKNLFQQLILLFKILLMALPTPKTSFGMFLSVFVGKKEVQSGRSKLLISAINGPRCHGWQRTTGEPSKFTRRKFKTNSHGSLKFSRMNNFLEFSRWGDCFSILKTLTDFEQCFIGLTLFSQVLLCIWFGRLIEQSHAFDSTYGLQECTPK